MDSLSILNRALETVHRSILKAEDTDTLPELDLHKPLPVASEERSESDPVGAEMVELDVDESDDQKPEPGLSASVRHGGEKVSTASAVRAQTKSSSDERVSADEWFQDVAWSGGGSAAAESADDSADEISALPDKTSQENTEDFFSGVSWDAESEPDAASVGSVQGVASDPDHAVGFFESTDWDQKGEPVPKGDRPATPAPADSVSGGEENAESFLAEMDWDGDGTGPRVSVDPSGEPPAHVMKLAEGERKVADLPATDDAINRAEQSGEESEKGDQ